MNNITTHETLINYLYNECSIAEKIEFNSTLLIDSELYNEFEDLKIIKKKLNKIRMNPSLRVQKNILEYARF